MALRYPRNRLLRLQRRRLLDCWPAIGAHQLPEINRNGDAQSQPCAGQANQAADVDERSYFYVFGKHPRDRNRGPRIAPCDERQASRCKSSPPARGSRFGNHSSETLMRMHPGLFPKFLMKHTPEDLKLALACELGDEKAFREFLARNPQAAKTLSDAERQKLPDAAQSNNTNAVRLMLEAGWPVDTPGEMGATALHWAGFHGNAEMTREILHFHPTLELKSCEYEGTALGRAVYGSGNGWHREAGDYVGTIRALLDAGAVLPPHWAELEPSDAVLEMLP